MTVVIAGAAGFIGGALLDHLLGQGIDAIGLTRRPEAARGRLRHVAAYDQAAVPTGAVLVHLAEERRLAEVERLGQVAVDGARDFCARLLDRPWAHVVYASSAVVYGDGSAAPRRPAEPVAPAGAYARAKLACEDLVRAAGGTVLRLANVFGRGMDRHSVLGDILAQVGQTGPLRLRTLHPVRDFIHVRDVAAGLACAVKCRPGRTLNIGSGRGITIGALARLVLDCAGEQARAIEATSDSPTPSALVLDITETTAALDWRPCLALEAGVDQLLRGQE
jgi:nucleoside-diphosphate-sugar epimerase